MKTIGLIGGVRWVSSVEYYKIINEYISEKMGRHHSAKIIMYSVDFEEVMSFQYRQKWGETTRIMIDAAQRIERGGADFILICSNTLHKIADEVSMDIHIPLLHIADATAEEIKSKRLKKVGLLGTKYTMAQDFYRGRLQTKYGLDVIIPEESDMKIVDKIIFDELVLGEIKESSHQKFKAIIDKFVDEGSEGVILGCTELPLIIKQKDSSVPLFDTTRIHALAAAKLALSEDNYSSTN